MSELSVATEIYDKILTLFPEAGAFICEEKKDLAYVVMGDLALWLESISNCSNDPNIVNRVKEFSDWVGNQPRGQDAGDDILTIFTVGFLEAVFQSEKLIGLVPHLLAYDDLVVGKDYWTTWVGATSYHWALSLYKPKTTDI